MADIPFVGPLPTQAIFTAAQHIIAKYPATVTQPPFDKWMMFSAMTGRHVVRNQVVAESHTPDRPLASVALYLPPSALTSLHNIVYDQQDLGPLFGAILEYGVQTARDVRGKGAGGYLDDIKSALGDVKGTYEKLKGPMSAFFEMEGQQILAGAIDSAEQLAAIFGAGAPIIKSILGTNATGAFATGVAFGQKPNPRTDILFDTMQYRLHELEFSLIPRTLQEAQAIDQICYFFQYYSLPKYLQDGASQFGVGSFLMGFPYEFEIRMFSANPNGTNSSLSHINNIGRSVLKGVNIDHAAGGKTAFIKKDGEFYPVATKLALQFQEVRLLDRNSSEIARGNLPTFPEREGA